ncbi:hypothetical protein [Amycolatopsis sp. NPDC054798]
MCRSSADGGRRCTGADHRTRALNTANRQVQRARRAVDSARAAGDAEKEAAAQARLDAATERRDRARDATQRAGDPEPAGQQRDTTPDAGQASTVVNYAAPGATVGLQGEVITGATVVINGSQVTTPDGLPDHLKQAIDNAHRAAEQAKNAAAAGKATVHHSDDHRPGAGNSGVIPFQTGNRNR